MNGFEAILFDFDGVLVDSEPVHYECWLEILQPFGIHMAWHTYAKNCIGVSDRAMIQEMCLAANPPADFNAIWQQYPRKRELFRERMAASDPFLDDTIDLIKSLSDYRLAVVSSSGRSEVEPPLIKAGIREHFGALVCGLEAGALKPAPEPYRRAAELLGVKRALVVEDSEAGEQAGRAAGFRVVRVSSPATVKALVLDAIRNQ